MAKRLPSQPPVLPGYAFIRPLGTGGFSDVFLFEQDLPRREVAVKVMLASSGDSDVLKMFTTEADALARLAAHPSILSVYGASRAADGRPYLVMEHCPGSYSTVYRDYVLSVGEVLDVGVRVAGALESVHRAGLLHRDVKPSNILRTVTGSPVLSDFGVATARFFSVEDDRIAMSIPWSPPEIISEDVIGSVTADIWSLGATVYSLLAGRSPFEQDGPGANTNEQLARRIRQARYAPINRDDVPEVLETVLARSMAALPASRQSSALVFGQQLQQVQRDLGLPVTEIEVLGADSVSASIDTMARSAVAETAGRIPSQISVDYDRRPRVQAHNDAQQSRSNSGGGASARVRRERSLADDEIPDSSRQRRISPALALSLAAIGVVTLAAAVVLVIVSR